MRYNIESLDITSTTDSMVTMVTVLSGSTCMIFSFLTVFFVSKQTYTIAPGGPGGPSDLVDLVGRTSQLYLPVDPTLLQIIQK